MWFQSTHLAKANNGLKFLQVKEVVHSEVTERDGDAEDDRRVQKTRRAERDFVWLGLWMPVRCSVHSVSLPWWRVLLIKLSLFP